MAQLVLCPRTMRGCLLLLITVGCGARTELAVPPDASSPIVDAAHDVFQPIDVVIAPDVATQADPTVIATSDMPMFAITVDDKNVYWTQGDWGPAPKTSWALAMQCEKTNCQIPIALATGLDVPLSIAVDHDNVYWTGGDSEWFGFPSPVTGLLRCAIGGCAQTPQVLMAGLNHGVVTNADKLFWVGEGNVSECVAGSCATPTTLSSGTGMVRTDGVFAYWSTETAIMRCLLGQTGCASSPVVVVSDTPEVAYTMIPSFRTFAIDSANIYWLSHGEVRRCPKDGCTTPITIMPDFNTAAQCIATDGVNVFWTAPSALVRCPITGCAKPIPVHVSHKYGINCVALDETNVYWTIGGGTVGGAIMTLPKP